MEHNFCRRCGTKLTPQTEFGYTCEQGHIIYANPVPAAFTIFQNKEGKLLLVRRAHNPGKGSLHGVGGFCDPGETIEQTLEREAHEELHITRKDHDKPHYLCSAVEHYPYGGETITVLTAVFLAALHDTARIVLNDEASDVAFYGLEEIKEDELYFPGLRRALELLKAQKETGE